MIWSFVTSQFLSADTSLTIINQNGNNPPQPNQSYQAGGLQVKLSAVQENTDGTYTATIASSGTVGATGTTGTTFFGPVPQQGGSPILAAQAKGTGDRSLPGTMNHSGGGVN